MKRISSGKLPSFIVLAIIFGSALIQTNIIKADQASYQYSLKWMHPDPYFIDVDSEGNVYVASRYNNNVKKFDSFGNPLLTWGGPGTDAGKFNDPEGIAVDSVHGFVYLTDSENNRVQKFDLNGVFKAKWGSYGSKNGEFNAPAGIAVDASGNVYVTDRENNRIQKFDSNGIFLMKWGSGGNENGLFKMPESIAVDSEGAIYVGDEENHRVQVFDAKGIFVRMLGTYGSQEEHFIDPEDVCVDKYGNVYVADSDNSRIQKFTSTGDFITSIGSGGAVDGKFNDPRGVAVDLSGNLYVADTGNVRIQKFTPLTATLAMTVSDSQGEPLSAADIVSTSQPVGQTPLSGSTDSHGRALFRNVAPGNYSLEASMNGDEVGSQNVDAEPGSTINEEITGNLFALKIKVITSNGSAIEGAKVLMVNNPLEQLASTGYTDTNGITINYGLQPGDYVYEVSKTGFTTRTTDPVKVTSVGPTEITVTLDTAAPSKGNLKIIVIDIRDLPILGVRVESFSAPNGQVMLSTTSETSHIFFFSNIQPGSYELKASKNYFVTSNTDPVSVTAGVTTEKTIILREQDPPTGDLEVIVKNRIGNPISGATVSMTTVPSSMQTMLSDITNLQGMVVFSRVLPGNYILKTQMNGFFDAESSAVTVNLGRSTDVIITMHSNVLDRFVFNPIPNTQVKDSEFDVTITAKDPFGETLESYSGTNSLMGSNISISPTSTGQFINGVWHGRVKVLEVKSQMNIQTINSDGKSGESNSFEVVLDSMKLDHFDFDFIISPQNNATKFDITIYAKDQYDQLFSGYEGINSLDVNGWRPASPPNTGPFIGGKWSGKVQIILASASDIATFEIWLTTKSPNGKIGKSNTFKVSATPQSWNILTMIRETISAFYLDITGTPCIIVTATYGGPYASEVVYIRHVRDDLIGSNDVGKVLVNGWNKFYYLWSPSIAYSISGSPPLRSTFTVLLLPLIGSMHVVAFVFESIVAFNPELASVISFLTAALMATTIYIILPIIILRALINLIIRNLNNK